MTAHLFGNRPQGKGAIRKKRWGPGWEAWAPQDKAKGEKSKKLGDFDMYHQAEKFLDAWVANSNAERKVG